MSSANNNGVRNRRTERYTILTLLVLGDLIGLILAAQLVGDVALSMFINVGSAVFLVVFGIGMASKGLYNPDGGGSRMDEILYVGFTIGILTLLSIILGAVGEVQLPFSYRGMVKFGVYGVLVIGSYRIVLRTVQKFLFRLNLGIRKTIIVGSGKRALQVKEEIERYPGLGYKLEGFVDDEPEAAEPLSQPLLGGTKSLPQIIREKGVEEVIITWPHPDHEILLGLLSNINGAPIEIKILPDMYEVVSGLARTEHVYGLPLIRINPDILTPLQAYFKRALDMWIGALGLIVTLPLMLILGVLIRLDTSGQAVFSQERVGQRGRRFTIHKFRTMVKNAEEDTGPVWATADDPRITKVGRFLRRTRLDELPQLWNVLIGDMSLVGPRPERPHFVEHLKEIFPYYHRRLLIRPGITGWAQVKGRYDSSIDDVRRKLKYDFFYIENLSIRLDLKILLMTAWVILTGKGH